MAVSQASQSVASRVVCTLPLGGAVQEGDTPVAIVLGWWGSKDRAVARFSHIYARHGFAVCHFIAYGSESFGGPRAQSQVAAALLDEVHRKWQSGDLGSGKLPGEASQPTTAKRKGTPKCIVVHVMSNNGAMIYAAMLRCVGKQHSWLLQGLRGVVFDCAPGKLSVRIGIKAFLASRPPLMVRLTILSLPGAVILWLLLALQHGRRWPRAAVAGLLALALATTARSRMRTERYIQELASDPSSCPQLFLYSQADALVPPRVVDDLIGRRRARGVHVQSRKWSSASHMDLLRDEPVEYADVLGRFVSNLEGMDGTRPAGKARSQ